MTVSPTRYFSKLLLTASQRRKKLIIRALRLRRHREEGQNTVRSDLFAIGVPVRRVVHAARDPLRKPVMVDPEY
jgi:hypothetical protein